MSHSGNRNYGGGPPRDNRGGSSDERGCQDERGGPPQRRAPEGQRQGRAKGSGPNTQFLQMEMSQLLYEEAKGLTRQAFREVVLEEAKARLRERFGSQIKGLAQLAVDEMMNEVEASLHVEATIQDRNAESDRTGDRLKDIFRSKRGPREERGGQEGGAPPRGQGGGPPAPGGQAGGPPAPEEELGQSEPDGHSEAEGGAGNPGWPGSE